MFEPLNEAEMYERPVISDDCCHATPMLVLVYMKLPHDQPLQLGEATRTEPSAEIVTRDEFPGDE